MKQVTIPAGFRPATLIFTIILICGVVAGSSVSGDELTVYAGAVVSPNPVYDSVALVEFPFSIHRHEFSFFIPDSADANYYARVFAQVDLLDSSGYAVDSTFTYFSLKVSSLEEAARPNYRVFNRLKLFAPPGEYSANVTVIDAYSKHEGRAFVEKVSVGVGDKAKLSVGGARVAYDVRYVGEDNPNYNPRLLKNGFYVIPNPVSIFAESDTIVYLYAEVYNLAFAPPQAGRWELSLSVLDGSGAVYLNAGSRVANKPGGSAVIAESVDIKDFGLGSYKLQIAAKDLETGAADTALVDFHVVSTAAIVAAATPNRDTEHLYAELPLEDHVNMVKHLMLPEQLRTLNGLADVGKKNFLDQFWREHDKDPTTSVVEYRLEMIERYRYVNRMFSTNQARTNGWATDRGRIYLSYGEWDERDDHEAPRVGNSYEVWYYRQLGEGKYFVFEDWSGNDDYRLVHSNVYGEVYDKKWQDLMDQGYIDMPD